MTNIKNTVGISILAISTISMTSITTGHTPDESPCFTPTYAEKENLVPHPECDNLNGFGGWGTKTINTEPKYVYCGDKSIAVASPWGGTLELNNLKGNTVYRFLARTYAPTGTSAIINAFNHSYGNGDIELWISEKTNQWETVDITFKTSDTNATGLYFVGATGNGNVYIDNYEAYIVKEPIIRIQYVDEKGNSLKEERTITGEWGLDPSKYLRIGQEFIAEKDKQVIIKEGIKYHYNTASNSDRIIIEEGENILRLQFTQSTGQSNNANLMSITIPDGQMEPEFSYDITEYNVLLAGNTSIRPICEKQEPEQEITGDDTVNLTSGTGRSEIVVTAEDDTSSKTYIINYKVIPTDDSFTQTYPDRKNLIEDPYCRDLNKFGGWGAKTINTNLKYIRNGKTSIAVSAPFKGTLEIHNLQPNTVYRLIAQVYATKDVTAQFGWFNHGLGNGDIYFNSNTGYEKWQKADFTLKTSDAGGNIFFTGNHADGLAYIDNYELYTVEEPSLKIHFIDTNGNTIKNDTAIMGNWISMEPSQYLMIGHEFIAQGKEYDSFVSNGVYYELDRENGNNRIILEEGENELTLRYNPITIPPSTYLYVAPDGNDTSQGTELNPFATIGNALAHARKLRQKDSPVGEIHIILKGGTYSLDKTITLTHEDSGKPYSPTIIEAAEGESPVISGGAEIKGWNNAGIVDMLPEIAQQNIWTAPTPRINGNPMDFRQLYVNGVKMKKASTFDDLSMARLISVDKSAGELVIPRPTEFNEIPENLEMTIIQDWVINHMRVDNIKHNNDYQSTLTFKQPESEIEFKRPWPILKAEENSFSNHCYYFSNALELLNRPQEWFNDRVNGKVYYWPRFNEKVDAIKAIAPIHETLVNIEGTLDNLVSNITFKGITFEHTTWMRPSTSGQISLQAGQYLIDAYSDPSTAAGNVAYVGRPSAGISVKNARGINFEDCLFQHMASTAVDFESGTKQVKVEGCAFNDIGGTAIQAGFFGSETFEAHQPYNPKDFREVCDSIYISNNYIVNTANEDWGCLGICVGFAANVNICHNELRDLPYSAISMGWGWNKALSCMHGNHITANHINGFATQMRDAGAIYTLSAQPNSSIQRNRIERVGDPLFDPVMWDMRHSQFDIYTDEGTDYFTVKDNWCSRGEISKNKNGNHNTWGENSLKVDESIKLTAGLEDKFTYIRDKVKTYDYAPLDSISEPNKAERIDYIAPNEGFKTGTAIAVDLNNDNLPDIVYGGGESFQVQTAGVRINTGNYGFAATQGLKRLHLNNLAASDLNGDNYIDLIQAGWDFWNSYNAILFNDGTGRLEETELRKEKNTSPACGIADINNDGLNDIFFIGNEADNDFYLQEADRSFADPVSKLTLPGGFSDPNMIHADFNNDQNVDICLLSDKSGGAYTKIWYNDGKGNFTERNVGFTEKGTRGSMAYADVNGDGYIDIAIGGLALGEQWDTPAEQGGKTVTLYLNDKQGGFTKHQEFSEYMLDNVTQPIRFCDWDNDGHSDLIITGWNISQGNISQTDIYLNDGKGNFILADIDLPSVSEGSIEVADFTGNGKNDILISGNCNGGFNGHTSDRRIATLCKNTTNNANTAPKAPSGLSATISKDKVELKWNTGSDKESPQNSLSYNFYIRDLNTGRYLTSPDADITTGTRRVSRMGNAWTNHGWKLQGLPVGKYAWSVQTIDAGYKGSEFAPEQTFTIEDPNAIKGTTNSADKLKVTAIAHGVNVKVQSPQKVTVTNIEGKCIFSKFLQTRSIDIPLPPGFYLVNSEKVIVNRGL